MEQDKALKEAIQKIWEVEKDLEEDTYERASLYRARIEIMNAQGALRS